MRLDEQRHDRRRVFDGLRAQGIGVNVHYIPVHTQPYYRQLGFRPGDCPAAERFYQQILSLPLYPGLEDAAQQTVIEALRAGAEAGDLTERARDNARLTTRQLLETAPALVLAYDYYEDAERDAEIVSRNAVRHPGFVPASSPLRVLTR